MILITVHDTVSGTWSNPVAVQNDGAAVRDFKSACADKRTMIGQHPADFMLYAIADWQPSLELDKLPTFKAYESPVFLMQGVHDEQDK